MSQSQVISVPITSSQLPGAIIVNVFALASAIAIVSVISRVAWLAFRRHVMKSDVSEGRECVFFQTQLGNYATCLLIGMMFNSLSGVIGVEWLAQRRITEGVACQAQAFIMQIGNFSSGYFTTAIAVHTFNSLALKMRQSAIICRTTISVGWFFTGVIGIVPLALRLPQGPVYGPDGLGCGIRAMYPKLQFTFHVLPILLASVLGAILYSLIFLILRGTLKLRSGFRLTLDPNVRWNDINALGENYYRFIGRVAKSMLWYPVAYIALLLPYAITRLFMISGFTVPFKAIAFASACWYSLCVVDVLLLYNTFRVLGPAFDARSTVATKKLESFGAASNLEKFGPIVSPGQPSDVERKIREYRSQSSIGSTQMLSDRLTLGHSSAMSQSGNPLLAANAEDITNRDSGYSNATLIGRPITPAPNVRSDYMWDFEPHSQAPSPISVNSKESRSTDHQDSAMASTPSLPVPPRQTRSPVLRKPVPEMLQAPAFEQDLPISGQRLINQPSLEAFGRRSNASPPSVRSSNPAAPTSPSLSIYSDSEGDEIASEWSSKNLSSATRRHPMTGQPLLSPFRSDYPVDEEISIPPLPPASSIERNKSYTSAHRPSLSSSSHGRTHRPLPSITSRSSLASGAGNSAQRF